MRGGGYFFGFALSAVVAPQVVLTQWPQIFINRNHGRTSRIESDGFNLIAGNSRLLYGRVRSFGQCSHVVIMGLGGVLRIFALAVQGIFRNCGSKHSALAVHNGNTDAQGSKVDSGDNRHPFLYLRLIISIFLCSLCETLCRTSVFSVVNAF